MHARKLLRISMAGGLLALLAACDDGSSDLAAPATPVNTNLPTNAAQQAAFISDYGTGVTALNSYGGLTSTTFPDLFDDAFLDAGYTKPQVRANLAQEAAAQAISAELSSFAAVKLSAVSIGNCDARNICVLTATLTNTDADTTAATFTTQLKYDNAGKFRLYGDQQGS
jgi:hypothetical protein